MPTIYPDDERMVGSLRSAHPTLYPPYAAGRRASANEIPNPAMNSPEPCRNR